LLVRNLTITGFRGIANGHIRFGEFTVLIGQSNSGKTTIIEALALLLGRDRLVRPLTEHDFRGSNPAGIDRIKLVASVGGFEPNDPHHHTEWFRSGRGIEKWLCAETGAVKAAKTADSDELICQFAFSAMFNHETLEVETCRYFHDDDEMLDPFDEDASQVNVPASLIKDIGFFLVPASKTWDRMISFGSELFRRVVSYVGGKPAEAVLLERDRLRAPEYPLEDDGKLKELVGNINADLSNLFGRPSKLSLRLTTTDSDGVLDAVFPHFSEGDGIALPSRRHGSGLVSLQTLVLLMRFGSLRVSRGENFLMCIEEPELHIPPPQQRKLIHLMQGLTTQTVVTTHSPAVAAMAPSHQLVLVTNDSGILSANTLLKKPLDATATNTARGLSNPDDGLG
jgi:putative ATP-dependent endonuclease of OLD family